MAANMMESPNSGGAGRRSLRCLAAGTAALAVLATSCGAQADDAALADTDAVAVACDGQDAGPGLDLGIRWGSDEVREFTRTSSSSGAGVPPDIDGLVLTAPLTITAADIDSNGGTVRVVVSDSGTPTLNPVEGIEAQFLLGSRGEVEGTFAEPAFAEIARDVERYHFVTSLEDGETITEAASMTNPLTATVEDATRTIEHLGTDEQSCEVVRATLHIGPDAVIEDLDNLLDELDNPDERPNAFADIGFEGAVVQSTTYRFDHGIDRLRSVEFTEAWGIFGAGGIDTRVETRVLTDVTDR